MLTVLTIPLQFFNYVLAEITGGSLNRLTIDGITSFEYQGSHGCQKAPPVRTSNTFLRFLYNN